MSKNTTPEELAAVGITKPLETNRDTINARAPKEQTEDEIMESIEGPMLNSADDIEMPEEVVPPISFEGLPEHNFIKTYVNYVDTITDTYPEFALQNALSGLSILVKRRICFNVNGGPIYTNLWTGNLGMSSMSRKTASMSPMKKILNKALGDVFLSSDFSKEGMISEMADYSVSGDSEPNEMQSNNDTRKALCALWKDEAGTFFSLLNKPHMQGSKEMLCDFFGCPELHTKNLSKSHMDIIDIYFSMNWATTPSSFYKHTSTDDIESGFLPRQHIVSPTYHKKWFPSRQQTDKNVQELRFLEKQLKLLDFILPENTINVTFSDGIFELWNNWVHERSTQFEKQKDENMGMFISRLQMGVLKMAILIELGNYPGSLFNEYKKCNGKLKDTLEINSAPSVDEDDMEAYKTFINNIIPKHELTTLNISTDSMLYSIKLHDEVYLPYAQIMCNNVGINESNLNNVYKVQNMIKKKHRIDRSTIQRNAHIKGKDLDDILQSLMEANIITEHKIKTGGGPRRMYVYIPSVINKLKFTSPTIDENKEMGSFVLLNGVKSQVTNEEPKTKKSQKKNKKEPESYTPLKIPDIKP